MLGNCIQQLRLTSQSKLQKLKKSTLQKLCNIGHPHTFKKLDKLQALIYKNIKINTTCTSPLPPPHTKKKQKNPIKTQKPKSGNCMLSSYINNLHQLSYWFHYTSTLHDTQTWQMLSIGQLQKDVICMLITYLCGSTTMCTSALTSRVGSSWLGGAR